MATIKRKDNGAYKITVSMGRDQQGKQIRKCMDYTPKATSERGINKEVQQAAADFEARVRNGRIEGDRMTFSQLIPVWEQNWAMDHLTTSVREGYVSILRTRVEQHIGNISISKINSAMIESLLRAEQRRGLAIKTTKRTFTTINSVFKYAYRTGILDENPCSRVELPSERTRRMERAERKNEIHCFNAEEAKTFLKAIREPQQYVVPAQTRTAQNGTKYHVDAYTCNYTMSNQMQAYLTLAIYSGFRRGEMLALTWDKIDFRGRNITIDCAEALTNDGLLIKSPKSESGYRTVSLPEDVFIVLRQLRREQREQILTLGTAWQGSYVLDENRVFTQVNGLPMSPSSPRKAFKDFIRCYNQSHEEQLPEIRLHDLRHTAASLLIASGMDPVTVAHRLGHADVAVTLNTYSHMFKDNDREASDRLAQLLG